MFMLKTRKKNQSAGVKKILLADMFFFLNVILLLKYVSGFKGVMNWLFKF